MREDITYLDQIGEWSFDAIGYSEHITITIIIIDISNSNSNDDNNNIIYNI